MDSTSEIILCKCGCGEELINKKGGQLYLNDYHRDSYKEKEKLKIKNIQLKQKWKKNITSIASKFFELIDENAECTICGRTNGENLEQYNLPLKAELKPEIRDFRVLQKDSWNFYCLECFVEIEFIRKNK